MKQLNELLNIEFPIIQAPMAGVQGSALAIAVSNAGGLGSLPCGMLGPEAIRSELEKITAATDRPYNVNFFCHTPPENDPVAEQRWRATLLPFYQELGLDPHNVPAGAARVPFSSQAADILADFKPAVVSFHFGLPAPELLERVKSWGSLVISSATTVAEARWLEQNGADCVIAQGLEAGGHRGMFLTDDLTTQVGTFSLLPQIVEAIDLPVIAAGGIADARGVAAAMALGASGVQVGTAFMLCSEATTSQVHRKILSSGAAQHTAVTNLFSGRPARGIVNRVMCELGPVSDKVPAFPNASTAIGPLRKACEDNGLGDFTPLWAGQNVTGCCEISAAEMVRRLAAEY